MFSVTYSISPIVFSIGDFSVRWYALMYLAGFLAVMGVLLWRVRKKETEIPFGTILDVAVTVFLGGILGGRVGYAFLYDEVSSVTDFLGVFVPWDSVNGIWTGWYGMSFFGAIVGAIIASVLVCRWKRISFFTIADLVAPVIPVGIFFGRVGNFLNGELWGRETTSMFGVAVNGEVRYPSQIIEAFLEGILLFVILWSLRNKKLVPGAHLAMLGAGYGAMRFVSEFFRDELIYIGGLTQGQVYSLVLMGISGGLLWWQWRKYGKMSL